MATEIPRMNPPRAVPTLRIDYYSALLIKSEVGSIDRFPDGERLCSYAGLVPSVSISVDTVGMAQ